MLYSDLCLNCVLVTHNETTASCTRFFSGNDAFFAFSVKGACVCCSGYRPMYLFGFPLCLAIMCLGLFVPHRTKGKSENLGLESFFLFDEANDTCAYEIMVGDVPSRYFAGKV